VVIIAALNILLVAPLLPQATSFTQYMAKIAVGDEKVPVVMLSLVVFVLTGILYDLNNGIIRIYEGYPWRKSVVGKASCRRQFRRLERALSLAATASSLRTQMALAGVTGAALTDLEAEDSTLGKFLNSQLPDTEGLILPTRLGNVMRCFERYPFRAYGMDAIVLWPRLIAKIDSAFASNIDDAKTSFDFMLNMSFLSALTSFLVIAIGLAVPAPLQWHFLSCWLWRALLFALLALVFYYFAVDRAAAWGQQICSAFDLYRFPLLEALGYQQKPLSFQEERAMWSKISVEILYASDRILPLPYDQPQTRVIPYPSDIKVVVNRKFDLQGANPFIPVIISLTNADPLRPVSSLTVIDSLPPGYKYVEDSASVSSGGMEVRGFAPPEFFLGPIEIGQTIELSYLMRPVAS